MIIIKGTSRKIEKVWDLVKRNHSGSNVAVVGYKGELPHSFIRAKQMQSYETFSKENFLEELSHFFEVAKDRFEAVILYIDCEHHQIGELKKITDSYKEKIFLTVQQEGTPELVIEQH